MTSDKTAPPATNEQIASLSRIGEMCGTIVLDEGEFSRIVARIRQEQEACEQAEEGRRKWQERAAQRYEEADKFARRAWKAEAERDILASSLEVLGQQLEALKDAAHDDALLAIADEIESFEHSARADSLRVIAKRIRAATAEMAAPKSLVARKNTGAPAVLGTPEGNQRVVNQLHQLAETLGMKFVPDPKKIAAAGGLPDGPDARFGQQHSFQDRTYAWVEACFGPEIANDPVQRNQRFLEEALELVQACDLTADEAHEMVDFVFARPVGDKEQEVGAVLNTLAALCQVHQIDMAVAGEAELIRVQERADEIRAKWESKPKIAARPPASSEAHLVELDTAVQNAEYEQIIADLQEALRKRNALLADFRAHASEGRFGYPPGALRKFVELDLESPKEVASLDDDENPAPRM